MKTVIDCNVIISAAISQKNCKEVIKKIISHHQNFISTPILLEYKNVISRKKFDAYKPQLIKTLEIICRSSSYIEITNHKCKYSLADKNDEIYLKTALESQADLLITGNLKDFPEGKYENTQIINPKQALELL